MYKKNNDILKIVNMVIRRKYIFILISLIAMTSMTVYGYLIPKKYQADCTVFMEDSMIDDLVSGIAIKTEIKDRDKVIKYSLLSRDLIVKTLEKLNASILNRGEDVFQMYLHGLQKRTRIKVNKNDLFTVSIVDSNPLFAQKYVNTLVETYIEENISSSLSDTHGANKFLEEQLKIFKGKLDKAEDKIIDFRRKQGVYFSVDEETELTEIKLFLRNIEDIDLSIDTATARWHRLEEQLASLSPTVDVLSRVSEGNRLVDLQKRLRSLRLRYTESYPEVVRLKSEIDNLNHQFVADDKDLGESSTKMTSVNPLYQEIQQQIFEAEAEVSSLAAKKLNLENLISQKEKTLHDVPENKKELGILVQERNSYRQIYQEFLKRKGQSEVSSQIKISDKADTFRIVDPAIFPETPVAPNMVRIILMAIATGLGCGFGIVVLLENFDTTLRDSEQLESMGVEVLAIIPRIANEKQLTRTRLVDYCVYGVSGTYFSGFFGLIFYEFFYRY